jgi:hypothetical protein
MGEAKRRKASTVAEHETFERRLRDAGVDTSQFGFYDQPAFLDQEARDPTFLEVYAGWVQTRPYSQDYAQRVRAIVPRLAETLAGEFEANDMQRSCVAASSMMPRILDRLGIWSFGLRGSLTMEVPARQIWRGQALIDVADFPGAELGHAWVVAPPFRIIDPTIRLQNPPGDAICEYVPAFVAVEDTARVVRPNVTDVVSAEIRARYAFMEGREDPQLHYRLNPSLRDFSRNFPTLETTVEELTLRYVPAGVRISDVPLEQINSGGRGLSGHQVWEIVRGELGEFEI